LPPWSKTHKKEGDNSPPYATATMLKSLQEALQDQVSKHTPISKWIEAAQGKKLWNDIIDEWYEVACQVSFTDFER
jgi:hypothetical protein